MSDGGRRVPRPLALAPTGRKLRRRLRAPGTLASPAARLPGCVAAAANERSSHHYNSRALVIEDLRTACAELRARGYMCDRITHAE
eukprot:9170348-Pyramimonas_sp.AAC.1